MSALRKQVIAANAAAVEVVAHEAQEIATISADYRQATGVRKSSLLSMVNERFDDLIATMLDVFSGSVEASEMEQALDQHHPLTESRLSRLDPGAVPLVVVRELLSVHLMPVKRSELRNWGEFADRYRAFV